MGINTGLLNFTVLSSKSTVAKIVSMATGATTTVTPPIKKTIVTAIPANAKSTITGTNPNIESKHKPNTTTKPTSALMTTRIGTQSCIV